MSRLVTEQRLGVNGGEGGAAAARRAGSDERRRTPRIRLRIPRDASAAGMARRALEALEDELDDDLLQTLRLLMTELVTNSVRHADAPEGDIVDVEVGLTRQLVRVEVGDGGSGFDAVARTADQDEASGWGLHLVDQLASRWGVRRTPGTCVWFEIDRRPRLRGI